MPTQVETQVELFSNNPCVQNPKSRCKSIFCFYFLGLSIWGFCFLKAWTR
eukprot:m.58961 g.58961  ORF g.58961 m.58961 type:complete len:50 (-) comp13190_c1_seq1:1700-1849(-)